MWTEDQEKRRLQLNLPLSFEPPGHNVSVTSFLKKLYFGQNVIFPQDRGFFDQIIFPLVFEAPTVSGFLRKLSS